ncbi:BLUF domain-containing protein [Sphingorhabdus arenilitoris]|uniref:BLUF domain-containing protein n=1 Tax=Sphingorhabdus arenilitoris TaxID=1490041 RepID=A0ABV8REF7_9SPHN
MFLRLLYISTADKNSKDSDQIRALTAAAAERNKQNGLTGLLIFDGYRFMQYLEGEETRVRETFQRIKADKRHFAVVTLSEKFGEERQFEQWDMALRFTNDIAEVSAQMHKVMEQTRCIDIMTAADLQGFVERRVA